MMIRFVMIFCEIMDDKISTEKSNEVQKKFKGVGGDELTDDDIEWLWW